MIPWLSPETPFPPLSTALVEPDGLLAAGGDLSSQRLIDAYRKGIFPWYSPGDPILWWSPNPRCVVIPGQSHLSRSLKKRLRKQDFQVTFDQAFDQVMRACAAPRSSEDGTWITNEMYEAYCILHQQGVAHSVEVWQEGELTGGLYGVSMGRVFFGESMFSRKPNTSKIAFSWLVEQLSNWDYALIDCQVRSEHLMSLGACEISRDTFVTQLEQNVDSQNTHHWQFDIEPNWFEKSR